MSEIIGFKPKIEPSIKPIFTKKIIDNTRIFVSNIQENDLNKFFEINSENSKISLKLSVFESREDLISFFDQFFQVYFISKINITSFQNIILNFDSIKENNDAILLGAEISRLDPIRMQEYSKIIINKFDEIGRVDGIFSRIYTLDEKGAEKMFEFKLDEFIAFLYQNGIKYGYDESSINKGLNSKYYKGEIAKNLLPSNGQNSTIKSVIKLTKDSEIKELGKKENINMKQNNLFFPVVKVSENNGLIIIKTKPTHGKKGIDTKGNIIPGLLGTDKFISNILAGDGVYIEEDENCEYFIAKSDGFINIEYDNYNKSLIRRVSVTDEIINKEEIGPSTGNVYIKEGNKFIQKGAVKSGYELRIENNLDINYHEGIDGDIFSNKGDIHLIGNKLGGKTISYYGNVYIEGKALSKAYIEASNGTAEIDFAEHCLIVGKKVKIKQAVGCDIIADEVEIETSNVCNIITKKSLLISKKMNSELIQKRNGEKRTRDTNIVFLCKKEVIGDARMLKKVKEAIAFFESERNINRDTLQIIQELNERAKDFSSEIDMSLEENKNKVFMKLNAGESLDYVRMYLGDFYESFDITKLNYKGEELKFAFIELLLTLFDEAKNVGNNFLTEINITNEGNEKKQVILDFAKIKKITEDEINKGHLIKDNPIEYKHGAENRTEVRTILLSEKEFMEMRLRESGHLDITIAIDIVLEKFYGSIKNISSGGIAFYLRESDINDNYPHLQNGKLVEITTEILGQKINLNAIIKSQINNNGIITFGAQFVWSNNPRYIVLNRQIKNKIGGISMELQRLLQFEKRNNCFY